MGASLGVRDTGGVSSNTSETVGVVTVITVVRFGFSGALANTLRGEVFHAFANSSVRRGLGYTYLGGSLGVRSSTTGMTGNTGSVQVRSVVSVESIIRFGFGFSGAFSTESKSLAGESGSTVSGPLEGRRVTQNGVSVSVVGIGRSHGSQSGQLKWIFHLVFRPKSSSQN